MVDLSKNASEYCDSTGIKLIVKPLLGAGTDGAVWLSDAGTAIKVFERVKNYSDELCCYKRFQENNITEIQGFAVPELEGYQDDLLVIEMSVVRPPYLLDFGKVYIDRPPPYFDDASLMNNWLDECRELFEDDWDRVQNLLNALRKFGIYYVDPKPANIRVEEQ